MDALAEQIAEVEQRLMAREAGLQRRLEDLRHDLNQGVRAALRPRRMLLPLASVLMLAWPLLPRLLRSRANPATVATLLSVGVPLARQWLALRAEQRARLPGRPPPATAAQVDLARYAGLWYEVARLPTPFEANCAGQPTAFYEPVVAPEGVPTLRVVNRCLSRSGHPRQARGVARVVEGSGGARLKVSFLPRWLGWLPGAWADYWILHVDPGYTEALVGDPARRHLWVLSRTPAMEPARLQSLLARASEQGFDVSRVLHVAAASGS